MNRILVTIIIPVYNVADWIERCLLSVCNQTYTNIECIIVNDSTPDNSMQIVDRVLESYVGPIKFKVLTHEKNRGLSAARNTGVKNANGDYLFFLDSDDELYSDRVVDLFNSYIKKYGDADFFIGNYECIGAPFYLSLSSDVFCNNGKDIFYSYLKSKWYVMACGKFIKRSFFMENEMWFKKGVLHEDELFSFRLAFYASTMVTVYEKIYKYKIRNNSIASNRGLKNYVDLQTIIFENYALTKSEQGLDKQKHVISYFISVLFGFTRSVMNCSLIPAFEKRHLFDCSKFMLYDLSREINLSYGKIYVESLILRMHYRLLSAFMKILG